MSSERNYNRGYLTPDGYYKQEMAHLRTQEGYEDADKSDFGKIGATVAGLTVGVGSAKYLYDQGAFKSFIQRAATDMANSQGLLAFNNMMDSVKEITSRPDGNLVTDIVDIVHNNTVGEAIEKAKIQSLAKQQQMLENLEIINYMGQQRKLLSEIRNQNLDQKVLMTLENNLGRDLIKNMELDTVAEAEIFKKTGLRHATVSDIVSSGRLDSTSLAMIEEMRLQRPEIMKSIADRALLVKESGEILDYRDFIESFKKMGRSAINDYSIPLLGINPAKMFYMDELLGFSEYEAPMFHHFKPESVQPLISYHNRELGASYIYSGGNIYEPSSGMKVHENMKLKRANGGMNARSLRLIADMHNTQYAAKYPGITGDLAFKAAKLLDLGFQDEMYKQAFDIMHPGTALPSAFQKIHDIVSPVERQTLMELTNMFHDDWIAMPAVKKLGEAGAGAQLVAGRKSLNQITEATMIPYMLTERMNRSIQPFDLGLSTKQLGSAVDVFGGLFGKRILPIVLGIGAIKYADYLLENKETKISPKDKITDGMVNLDTNIAGFRDKIGANERLDKFKELSPGINFLEEIPIIGKLLSSKTEEETREYWENGYDPVRKGRFWTLGNTPYGGGRVEYFRPNVKNRVQSDYQYTDVKWGSKEEYWANNWLPTPTHPFSPIKHFFTDPYHWENKHYKDRPYPISGGIAELREIPIIGGFLDATVGRVLKPQRKMHTEYWDGDKLKTNLEVESVPFEEITRPPQGLSGAPGTTMLPNEKEDKYNETLYSTSSGITSIYATPDDVNPYEINKALKEGSIKRVRGTTQVSKGSSPYGPLEADTVKAFNPNGLAGAVENAYDDAADLAGFYGFSVKTMIGDGQVSGPRLATSSDLYSYSDAFWDQSLGGFGGEISEIFRRFAPNKAFAIKKNELNPIRNTMPTWLPGPEYYINFLHGDPYEKVKEGEYRLPGAGYEAMYGLEDPTEFKIGSSSFGKEVPDLIKHFLQVDDIEISDNESLKSILDSGTKTHANVENEWMKIGYAVAHEYYVKDEKNNIEGWIDAIVKDNTAKKGYAVSDIKTINQKGYEEVLRTGQVKETYKTQINFYMDQMGFDKGYLHFINRDDPDAAPVTVALDYDKDYLQKQYDKLETSRNIMRQALNAGVVQRGDLYKPLDRFKILADVAPYSENFRFYDSLMSKMALKDEEKAEVAKVRERVSEVKEKMRVTPYKFSTANITNEMVTVKGITDRGHILTEEYGDNPLKIAGLKFSTNEDTELGKEAMTFLKSRLRKGSKIQIGLNADELNRVNKDTYSTMDAVIDTDNKVNLNRYMIQEGLGEENKNDDSATGVRARYSDSQILYGKIFEKASHRDTPFNTKFLQARSALEQYERRDLYGKDWQDWSQPVQDFLVPSIQNTIRKDPLVATATGVFIGSMFGAPGNRYGKLMGGTIGGAIALAGSLYVNSKAKITGEAYIPERRQKEQELNEYFDVLKYVKSMKLFDKYRTAAIQQENVDPAQIIAQNKKEGDMRKYQIDKFEDVKRKLYSDNISFKDAKKIVNFDGDSREALDEYINKRINSLKNHREAEAITPLAAQAIMYYNESEKTAYGYDPGEPIQNILAALNRKERKYFMPFLQAPEEERDQILKVAPKYMRRALQSAYGKTVDQKQNLTDYFDDKFLPGDDWAGWNPEVNLEDVKIKMVKHEGMDNSEFDIWEDDEIRASHLQIPIPKMDHAERASVIRDKLHSVLANTGLENLDIQVEPTDKPGVNIDMSIQKDRRKDIEDYVNSYGFF